MSRGRSSRSVKYAVAALCLTVALLLRYYGVPEVAAQQLSVRRYGVSDGLAHSSVLDIHQDQKGYLWFGTAEGLSRFDGYRFTNYTTRDGLGHPIINAITEDQQGRLWAGTNGGGVSRLIDDPREASSLRQGEGAPAARQKFVNFQVGASPDANRVNAMLFDTAGNLWCVTDAGLYRAAASPNRDRSGALWLGAQGLLGRLQSGRIVMLQLTDELPETNPRAFFLDSRGWLWIGLRYKGVSMTKDPTAEPLKFDNYSTANGLASDTVWTIAEDDTGRMYFGTGRGLDRLDLSTGRIRHFSTADGLTGDAIRQCVKDSQGNLWVAATMGLSKLNPRAERAANRPPPIYLNRVNVAGEDLPLAETGAALIQGLELPASRNNLLIEFVGLDFQGERRLKYQYKLEGVDTDWSAPNEQRSVNYARLSPGSYRFLARAVNQEEMASLEPAVLQFRILPPVWQRWWFLTLASVLVGSMIYAAYRYRVAQLIELERVRTRIATDLHDDIGSNLSLIAGLSQALRQQARRIDPGMTERLSLLATVSNRSVDAMSDIVWAVNPMKDHVSDLAQRMRRFASDALTAREIQLHFDAPDAEHDIKVGAEVRREVFLIFKEAINNIARHSACATVEVALRIDRGVILLKLSDDGKGFDPTLANYGNGLMSMRQRAEKLGGELVIDSNPGDGTTVMLKAPLGRHS